MFKWVYRIADGVFLYGGPCEVEAGAGEGVAVLTRNARPRAERWDTERGALREATVEEIAEYDATAETNRKLGGLAENKDLEAVVRFFSGHLGLNLQDTVQAIRQIRRGL